MVRKEIYKKLNEIFMDVLELDNLELADDTCADDIDEWDSLNNIQLVVEIENVFKVKFSSVEIIKWENVGEMVDSILYKLK